MLVPAARYVGGGPSAFGLWELSTYSVGSEGLVGPFLELRVVLLVGGVAARPFRARAPLRRDLRAPSLTELMTHLFVPME